MSFYVCKLTEIVLIIKINCTKEGLIHKRADEVLVSVFFKKINDVQLDPQKGG